MIRALCIAAAVVVLIGFRSQLASAFRGLVRCLFPVAAVVVWALLLAIDQGQDVLRAVVERLHHEHSVNDLVFLLVATLALARACTARLRVLLVETPQPGRLLSCMVNGVPLGFYCASHLVQLAQLQRVAVRASDLTHNCCD